MLPEITISQINETSSSGKSFLFDFNKGDFVIKDGKFVEIEGVDVIKQWVNATLRTEKFKYFIYQDHGVEIEDILENGFSGELLKIELKRTIKEALEVHEQIQSISNFNFTQVGSAMNITFTVNLTDGTSFGGEINV